MRRQVVVVLVLAMALPAMARWAPAEGRDGCSWRPGFPVEDVESIVFAMAVFDDGCGPALFVGGEFTSAGGAIVNGIARWDGTAWSDLAGPAGTGVGANPYMPAVAALAVFDDGSGPALYVGGYFTTAGGVTANHIARWDGSAWSALGAGVDGEVYALADFDDGSGPALYAGGWFTTAGGVTVNNIARWNGSAWSALGGPSSAGMGMDNVVKALAVFDDGSGPALYAGGDFATAGGVTVNHIARWDGSAWSALSGPPDPGTDGGVDSLAVFDDGAGPALYAGGSFATAGGVRARYVARWDGSAWSALNGPSGTGVNGTVAALAVLDDGSGPALFAGGGFWVADGVTVKSVARWDGSAWSALSGPSGTGLGWGSDVRTLAVFDDGSGPALYVGGQLANAGGVTVNNIARWDGSAWSTLGGPPGTGMADTVFALAAFDDGAGPALYAGGEFETAGGVTVYDAARWDGSAWSALSGPSGPGVDGGYAYVTALAAFDNGSGPGLYAGGEFPTAGGITVNSIARWDGSSWSALSGPSGTGVDCCGVSAIAVFDDGSGPTLYAGGDFTHAGGLLANGIARWNGHAWSPLSGPWGTGVSGWIYALAVFDYGSGPGLYVAGWFTTAGGGTLNGIARWDGSAWSALGAGINGEVYALAIFDDGSGPALYAGGNFSTAGGVTVNNIARWDGSGWSDLSGPSGTGTDDGVSALAVFDDGSGPALFAGGYFGTAGGVTVNNIARWDGGAWSDLSGPAGSGVAGPSFSPVLALAAIDDGAGPALFAGGEFTTAGGLPSSNIAAWRCPFDTTPPSDPVSVASTTHTPGAWSSATVIGVEWSGAADTGGSGLAGYSVLFDTSPSSLPDATLEVPQGADPHATSSGIRSDGQSHWSHLRTCDRAGNCSGGVHLGPFWIDATPPSGPFDLTSTSHTPGVPSSDRTVDLVWSPAVDAGSGLDGYAFEVSGASAWACDQVKDLEEGATSLTTPELADSAWYVHLCATDNLGNWGGVVSAGPYLIGAIFADGFELGDTSGWSLAVP